MENSLSSRNNNTANTNSRRVDKDNLTDSKGLVLHPSVIGITALFSLYVLFLLIYSMFSRRREKKRDQLGNLRLSTAPVDDILSDNRLNNGSCGKHVADGCAFSTAYQNTVKVLETNNKSHLHLLCDRKIASFSDMGDVMYYRSPVAAEMEPAGPDRFNHCKSASVFQREYSRGDIGIKGIKAGSESNNTDQPIDTTTVVFTLGPGRESFCSFQPMESEEIPITPTNSENCYCCPPPDEGLHMNRCSSSKSSIARTPSYRKACI